MTGWRETLDAFLSVPIMLSPPLHFLAWPMPILHRSSSIPAFSLSLSRSLPSCFVSSKLVLPRCVAFRHSSLDPVFSVVLAFLFSYSTPSRRRLSSSQAALIDLFSFHVTHHTKNSFKAFPSFGDHDVPRTHIIRQRRRRFPFLSLVCLFLFS